MRYVVQACADAVVLTLPELRRLGFSPKLLAALEADKRLQE